MKQAHCLTNRIILCQAVNTDLLFRHTRDIRIIDIPVQPCFIIKYEKFILRQDCKSKKLHLRISKRVQVPVRQLFHHGAADHMPVYAAAVRQVEYILLFSGRSSQRIRVCIGPDGIPHIISDKIPQNRILLRHHPAVQIIKHHIVSGCDSHHITSGKTGIFLHSFKRKQLLCVAVLCIDLIGFSIDVKGIETAVLSEPEPGHPRLWIRIRSMKILCFSLRIHIEIFRSIFEIGSLFWLCLLPGRTISTIDHCNSTVRRESNL